VIIETNTETVITTYNRENALYICYVSMIWGHGHFFPNCSWRRFLWLHHRQP